MKKLFALSGMLALSAAFVFSSAQAENTDLSDLQKKIKEQGARWTAGETEISRMTPEERKQLLGTFRTPAGTPAIPRKSKAAAPAAALAKSASAAPPASFSWGNNNGNWMTSVKNQGQCGSCWAHAACGVFEAGLKIAMNQPTLACDLSEQNMVSCWVNNCNGNYIAATLSSFENNGVPDEACFPYTSGNGSIPACGNRCSDWTSRAFFISDWGYIPNLPVDSIKNQIRNNGPLIMTMAVYSDFDYYTGGVYSRTSSTLRGYHAVVVYGWDNTNNCWLVKNSWGTGWGETGPDNSRGWFRIKMGTNESECESDLYWLDPQIPTPLAPVLVYPSHGATGIPLAFDFLWRKANAATSYQLQVAGSASFTGPIVDATLSDTVRTVGSGLLSYATQYYWRVKAVNSRGSSAWTVDSFTTLLPPLPPGPPVLVLPFHNATNVALLPTLKWNRAATAQSYTVELATSAAFASPRVSQTLSDTSLTVTGAPLADNVMYYWRVQATNSAGSSAWTVDSFTTIQLFPPNPPALVSPGNGATDIALLPTLQWNKVATAQSYTLEIANNPSFGSALSQTLSDTAYTLSVNLTTTTVYYWRVLATNTKGSSAWATTWQFTTVPPAPAAPVLVFPASHAAGIARAPALKWNKTPSAVSFRVQLASSSSFTAPILDTTLQDTSKAVGNGLLAYATQYFWRVQAINAGGLSAWTSDDFTTALPPPPPAPVLLTPKSNEIDAPVIPSLRWNKVADATSYGVQVSLSPSFSPLIIDQSPADTIWAVAAGLLAEGEKYYWRAKAVNLGGSSAWSTDSFTTIPPTPSAPVLVLPASNASDVSLTTFMKWNKVRFAASYRVQVAVDGMFTAPAIDYTAADTVIVVPDGLLSPSVKYFWRVRAKNKAGSGVWTTDSFTTVPPPCAAPRLVWPILAGNVPLEPTLLWNRVSGAVSYRVQVSDASSFSPLIVDATVTDTSKTVESGRLSANVAYFWRVQAISSGGASAWTTSNFTTVPAAPGTPTLVSPAQHAVNVPVVPSPALVWRRVDGVLRYRVQLATNASFSSPVIADSTEDSLKSLDDVTLSFSATYYWRVQAVNISGPSPWTTGYFTTVSLPPTQAPSLVSPFSNAFNIPLTPTFAWNKIAAPANYRIQVSVFSSFYPPVVDSTLDGTSKTVGSGLLSPMAKYFWRVQAVGDGGGGPWSLDSFYTAPAPPASPALLLPAHGAVNVTLAPRLAWTRINAAESYHVQVSLSPWFTHTVVDSTLEDSSKSVGGGLLAAASAYFWRVRAINLGGASAWTVDSFTTIPGAPKAPLLVFPRPAMTDAAVNPVAAWNRVDGAVSYGLQIASDSLFSALVRQDSMIVDTCLSLAPLANDRRYYWRVNASNVSGAGTWSSANSFSTIVAMPAAVVLMAPSACDTAKKDSVTLTWARGGPKVDRYWVEWGGDSAFSSSTIDSAWTDTVRLVFGLKDKSVVWWRVKAHNAAGWSAFGELRKFSVALPTVAAAPENYAFNAGNFSASRSLIRYCLPKAGRVSLTLVTIQGKSVRTFFAGSQAAGYYTMKINVTGLSRGCYLMHFQAGNFQMKKKVTLY